VTRTPLAVSAYSFRPLEAAAPRGEDTLAAAMAEADGIREAARAEGHAQGRREAAEEVRTQAAAGLELLADARRALDELRDEICDRLEADAAMLGLRLAEQIVSGTIEVEPERLTEIAGLALRRLADRRAVTLIVNPADLELLAQTTERLSGELGGIEQLHVQADRRVGRGGVLARTDEGEIDATVETQVSRARELVVEELQRGRAED
jgi:flagellar assembly protein FliH